MTLEMKEREISDMFVSKDGLKNGYIHDVIDPMLDQKNFLKKELGELAQLLDLNIDDYISNFRPLFFNGDVLYVIGMDSYSRLMSHGVDMADATDYASLKAMDAKMTKHFIEIRELYSERPCGNLVFIQSKEARECYLEKNPKKRQ